MSSFFSGISSSKYISSTKLPASTGPTTRTPNIPSQGTSPAQPNWNQVSVGQIKAAGYTNLSQWRNAYNSGTAQDPRAIKPTQTLSMGTFDPNTNTFIDSSGQKYSTAEPQKFNTQLVQQKAEQQTTIRQQTELSKRQQILSSTGPFKPVEQTVPTGPISSKPVFVSVPESKLAKEILKQDIKSSQTGFVSGSAVVQPKDSFFGIQEKKQVQKDIVDVGYASKSKTFKEARIKAQRVGEVTGVDLTGEVDEPKLKTTEAIIRFVGQKSFWDEQRVKKLESEQETFTDLSSRVDKQNIADKLFFDKWKKKDLVPESDEIVLSPEDYDLFVSEKSELDFSKKISDVDYEKAFQRIKTMEDEVQKELNKQSWVGKELVARSKKLSDVESGFNVFEEVAKERIGYDIRKSELKYSPVQRKETGDFASIIGLYKSTVFGEVPDLEKPVVSDEKSFEQLIGYKGRKEYERVLFAAPDPVDWASRVGTSMVVLGGIGAVGGSSVGSSVPFLGTGVGAVAGGLIGLKAGFVAGTADVIASETVGRVTGDEDIGRSAGFVAGLVGAVGASNLFLGKEVAKRTVIDVGKPRIYKSDFLSVETVPKEGLVIPKDTKFVSALGKQQIGVDVTYTLKPSTGKLDLFVSDVGKKLGYVAKPPVSKTVTKFFDVSSVSDSASVLTGTKFSRVAVEGLNRTDLVTGGTKDFFVTSGKVTSTIIPKGTVRSRIADLVSIAPKKIVSFVRGDKSIVSGFKEKTVVEGLGFSDVVRGKNWVISDYFDKIVSTGGDRVGLTRIVSSPDSWYVGKTFFGKDNVVRFVGQYSDDVFRKGIGFSSSTVRDVPKQLTYSPRTIFETGWLSKSMNLEQATSFLDSLGTQSSRFGAEVAQATVKSVSKSNTQQVMRLATQSGKSSLDSLYGGGIVLTAKSTTIGKTVSTDQGVMDTITRVKVGSIPMSVEKLRVSSVVIPVTKYDYQPVVVEKEFVGPESITKLRDFITYSPITSIKTDIKTIPVLDYKQAEKEDVKVIEKTRLDTKQKIDFGVRQPFTSQVVIPVITGTPYFGPLPSYGRMDSGAGVARFKQPVSTKKSVPLFQVKSDLFRKFVSGEKDIVVSKENVRLIKNIRGKKGSLLGFVPTKELLSKKKKKKKGKWFEEENNKWWGGFAL